MIMIMIILLLLLSLVVVGVVVVVVVVVLMNNGIDEFINHNEHDTHPCFGLGLDLRPADMSGA